MTDNQHPQHVSDKAMAEHFVRAYWSTKGVTDMPALGEYHSGAILAGIRAVRQALASSSAAIDVPDWVTHVEIEFQGPDPTWPNGTRWKEGMGATVAEAIADASKDGGQ